jgi:hypothetical protein
MKMSANAFNYLNMGFSDSLVTKAIEIEKIIEGMTTADAKKVLHAVDLAIDWQVDKVIIHPVIPTPPLISS